MEYFLRHIVILTALSVLSACGGGNSSTPATPPGGSNPAPNPPVEKRYVDLIFDNTTRISDVPFGSGARSGANQTLRMDIYTPSGDSLTNRPVMIFAFGGGFVSGFKRDPLITAIAQDFARRGYVTASIEYRFFEQQPVTEDDFNIAIMESMHDMKAAVRFFRENAAGANTYGTRGDVIFVGGVSAGGIMASLSGALDIQDGVSVGVQAFLDANNGLDGNSSANTHIASDVQGVFSISGAVTDFLWVDGNSAPIYAAHEEFDTTVPCRFALSNQGAPLAGGCDMVDRAKSFNVPSVLYLVEGSDRHVGYSLAQYDEFLAAAAAFFEARIPD